MGSNENSNKAAPSELINVQNPFASWLLGTSQRFGPRELIGVALILSGIPFVVSVAIAFHAGFLNAFLQTGTVYIWAAAVFGAGLTGGWWAKRYPELWLKLRPVFEIPDDQYRAVVQPRITNMYNLRRALLWFPVLFVVARIYDMVKGIDVIITPEALLYVVSTEPLMYAVKDHTFLLSVINYTFGTVSLLGLTIAIHVVFHHLRLVSDVMKLQLKDFQTAAAELTPLARFNTIISTGWFVILTLGLVLLDISPFYTIGAQQSFIYATPLASAVLLGLILLGFALFAFPQFLIHARIDSEKRSLLNEVDTLYEELHEHVSSTDDATNSLDQVSVQLDVLEARRRNTKEIQTWAYDWPGMLSLVATSVVPILSLIV